MALSGQDVNNSNVVKVDVGTGLGVGNEAMTQTASPKQSTTQGLKSPLSFKNTSLGILSSKPGSGRCKKLAEAIRAVLEDKKVGGIEVTVVDKTNITRLAYSSVVLSTKLENGEVVYYPVMVPSTGREALKAQEIVNEYANLASKRQFNRNAQPDVFTYDQAFDNEYDAEIKNVLHGTYKISPDKYFALDGLVLPYNMSDTDIEEFALVATISGANALIIDREFQSGRPDLNLAGAINTTSNAKFKLSAQFNRPSTNQLGQPVRSDFDLSFELTGDAPKLDTLNNDRTVERLSRVTGFIDAIPVRVPVQVATGAPSTEIVRLRPHVILTGIEVDTQTPAFLLLSILSSLPMLDKTMWPAPLIKNIDTVGHLNKITNIEGNANNVGRVIAPSKQISEIDIRNSIYQMFSLDPVLSIDIENYGVTSYFTSIIAAAANTTNPVVAAEASKQLVQTANQLTNGMFPLDFPLNKIFQGGGIKVPLGIWSSKHGDHDVREIDLAFITAKSQDLQSSLRWATSNFVKDATSMDPFGLKVEAIAELVPDATIYGSATRVTFSPEFVKALADAALASGLRLIYEGVVAADSGVLSWNGLPNGFGGISSAAYSNLATQYAGVTPASYYSPYTNMGGWVR